MSRQGFFVTGTDTGVGKTVVACAIVRDLRAAGIDIGAMKCVETGVGPTGPGDARALHAAAGASDALEEVCPQRFAMPAAPNVAAAAEGRTPDLEKIVAAYERIMTHHDAVLVEGAGGLLVPVTHGVSMADLARRLDLPLILVARASLGTINHTLLSREAARRRGLQLAGVIISHADGPLPTWPNVVFLLKEEIFMNSAPAAALTVMASGNQPIRHTVQATITVLWPATISPPVLTPSTQV